MCAANTEIVKRQSKASLLINLYLSNEEVYKVILFKTIEGLASRTPVLITWLSIVMAEYYEHVYSIDAEKDEGALMD